MAVALMASLTPITTASASECGTTSPPPPTTEAPEPYTGGDACVVDDSEEVSPPQSLARANSVDHHYQLGAQTVGSREYDAFYAAVNVVDPEVPHPAWATNSYLKQRIWVGSCNFGNLRTFEVGWTEMGSLPGQTQQYLYTRNSGSNAWNIVTNPALVHQPGERVYVELFALGGGMWGAYANSPRTSGQWVELARFDLGTEKACWLGQDVELSTGGTDFMFPRIDFGDGTTSGVNTRNNPSVPFQTWDTSIGAVEQNVDGNGGYRTQWRSKYYDWSVTSQNAGPVAQLYVSPPEGDVTTQFEASLEQSRDPNGDALSYVIDWGDGTVTNGPRSTHQYSAPGEYTVVGTVTEIRTGRTSQADQSVTVCAVAAQGQCAAAPGLPDSPDPCADAEVCEPETPAPPTSLAPARDALALLPRTPKGDVVVVDANVLQAYARASNPRHSENCSTGAKTCRSDEREAAFAGRLRALSRKPRGALDGMGAAPDVILLQEAIKEDARGIAQRLRDVTPYNYVVAAAEDDPLVEERDTDGNGTMDTATKSDSAIVYNKTTMIRLRINSVTTTYDRATEGCPGGPQIDDDFDGIDDCEIAKWKKHFTGLFAERKVGTDQRLRGGHSVAVASVHYVTASHLNSPATHESKTTTWSNQVANDLQDDFANADSWVIGGDFNIERCVDDLNAGGVRERVACSTRTWWRTLTDESTGQGFEDDVFVNHNASDTTLSAQYRDGCDEFDREGNCVQHFREKRIDMLFSKGPDPVAASHDLTCGVTADNTGNGVLPNCDDLRNAERYSDHRLLWTLIRD